MKSGKIFSITIDNKILLYLLSYGKIDEFRKDVSLSITQEGIAESIKNPLGSVSRTLKKLTKNGFLQENLCRVEDRKRKMKAYTLTWEGKTHAKKQEQELKGVFFKVKDKKGNIKDQKLSEVLKRQKPKMKIIDIVNYLSIYTVIDPETISEFMAQKDIEMVAPPPLEALPGPAEPEPATAVPLSSLPSTIELPPKGKKSGYFEMITTIPKIRHFYGREKELTKLEDFINNYKTVIIYGIAGIGKSILAAKFVIDKIGTRNIFWYSIKDWDTSRDVLVAVAELLYGLGKRDLKSYLSSTLTLNFYNILKILKTDLNGTNAIIVFDDFHHADKRTVQLFSALTDELDNINNANFIIISREYVPFYDRRDVDIEKNVMELKLEGLNKKDSIELTHSKDIKTSDFNIIFKATKGHPLALELIGSPKDIKTAKGRSKDIFKFIHEEIFSKLSPEESSVLQILSVYRQPVLPDAIIIEDNINYAIIDKLASKSLITEIITQRFEIQDLVKDFFYSRLSPAERTSFHEFAAQYYLKQGEVYEMEDEDGGPSFIESAYHLIEAGNQNEAVGIILDKAPGMISRGNSEGIMNILSKFDTKTIDTRYLSQIYNLKGDILDLWGEWDNVLEYYYQCYLLSKYVMHKLQSSKLHEIVGYMGWKTHEIDIALENLRNSMAVLEGTADPEGVDEVNRSLGWIHWLKGDYKKAIAYYNKVLVKTGKASDQSAKGKIFINLGNIFWEKSNFKKAIDYYNKSLKIFIKLDDFQKQALVYNYLGCVYTDRKEYRKSLENFDKSLVICSSINFVRCEGYIYLHIALNWLKQNNFGHTKANLERAIMIFNKIDDKFGFSYGKINYGVLFLMNDDYSNSIVQFNESIELLQDLDLPFYLAETYLGIALAHRKLKHPKKSEEYEKMADEIFKVLADEP